MLRDLTSIEIEVPNKSQHGIQSHDEYARVLGELLDFTGEAAIAQLWERVSRRVVKRAAARAAAASD